MLSATLQAIHVTGTVSVFTIRRPGERNRIRRRAVTLTFVAHARLSPGGAARAAAVAAFRRGMPDRHARAAREGFEFSNPLLATTVIILMGQKTADQTSQTNIDFL